MNDEKKNKNNIINVIIGTIIQCLFNCLMFIGD